MEVTTEEIIRLPERKIKTILHDAEKAAQAVNLIYVSDTAPGITRIKKGKSFSYLLNGQPVKDKEELQRIKSLVIPPAWENVWICPLPNGHLQATGLDKLKRKQYRYHPLWNALRNHTKFYRLHEFGKVLPTIRLQLEKDVALPGLPVEKVLATVVSLMERTHIRIGNNLYEKLYGSFGLTTLKDKHVHVDGAHLRFTFKGKKGVEHNIDLKSKKLAYIVKQCRDIPGKELFQYYDEEGNRKSIDSGMVNNYIKQISGGDFTAKDFRTWAGTVQALLTFKELGFFDTETETKKKIVEALDIVSRHLGNTRTVCKKYYVHPLIITLYESKELKKYIDSLDSIEQNDNKTDLTPEEKLLMKILEAA
ncbi:DNA topoisomerase IB [Ilyomonas limi]|uniref:DNA topoisomerase n=1 Tax=Ilyomonas limi TaxID=2575867 RepID=A0A4U3LAS6_9BACT|nr:DNA topoisomerase IB [Ilyomonas limi]TKK71554.1 DNA topoisomerase IB [Ilyomonas limi]